MEKGMVRVLLVLLFFNRRHHRNHRKRRRLLVLLFFNLQRVIRALEKSLSLAIFQLCLSRQYLLITVTLLVLLFFNAVPQEPGSLHISQSCYFSTWFTRVVLDCYVVCSLSLAIFQQSTRTARPTMTQSLSLAIFQRSSLSPHRFQLSQSCYFSTGAGREN